MVSRQLWILIFLAAVTIPPGPAKSDALAVRGRSDDVPADMQQAITDHFMHSFVLPQLVLWDFRFLQPYPTGGIAVCGTVNYPNSTRQYAGKVPFFARFENGRIIQAGIVARSHFEDPVHANANAYKIACGDD
jgi:hypothetical protein